MKYLKLSVVPIAFLISHLAGCASPQTEVVAEPEPPRKVIVKTVVDAANCKKPDGSPCAPRPKN